MYSGKQVVFEVGVDKAIPYFVQQHQISYFSSMLQWLEF
jgi:hypothetical protein